MTNTKRCGVRMYVTFDEFSAISESYDQISTLCESAGEEYVDSVQNTLKSLRNLHHKFLKAEYNQLSRKKVIKALKKCEELKQKTK